MIEKYQEITTKLDDFLEKIFLNSTTSKFNISELATIKYGKGLSASELGFNFKYNVYGSNGIIGTLPTYEHDDYKISISCRGASSGKVILTEPFSTISSNSLYLDLDSKLSYLMPSIFYSLRSSGLESFATGSAQPQITIDNLKTLEIDVTTDSIVNSNAYILIKYRSKYLKKLEKLKEIKASLLSKYF